MSKRPRPLILFAHGAGAPSTSAWMKGWTKRLAQLGDVTTFDYPYMAAGRKRPDRPETLIEAHREALRTMCGRKRRPVVLAGKSMGSRIGCHVSTLEQVDALVCFGYPLVSMSGKLRDEVLRALTTPILFLQGTRDRLCPLDELKRVRRRMKVRRPLHVVDTGDHSLLCTKRPLRAAGRTQADVDDDIQASISSFLDATWRAKRR